MGIYIHIPFCKQACHYCNFFFTVSTNYKREVIEAITRELILRKSYLREKVNTIYFGGGTPSILEEEEIRLILDTIYSNYSICSNPEITFEVNPDDIFESKLVELQHLGINRLSMGIQSFDDYTLKFLNRAHNSKQALQAFELARKVGFQNINIDLMYSIPNRDSRQFSKDLHTAVKISPEHISSYCLTIEKNTYFDSLVTRKKLQIPDDEEFAKEFEMMVQILCDNNYIHYEVSNFSKQDYFSNHNTGYWLKKHYLGVGPSAHSYDGDSRQWNVKSIKKYIDNINKDIIPCEYEYLKREDHINEYLMIGLRSMWGCDLNKLNNNFNFGFSEKNLKLINQLKLEGLVKLDKNILKLTTKGYMNADRIAQELFIESVES